MKVLYYICFILLSTLTVQAQNKVIGVVLEKEGEHPLPGVTVQIAGTMAGVSTTIDGKFQVLIARDTAALVFTTIGFKPQRVSVVAGDTLQVLLRSDPHIDYFYKRYVGISWSSGVPYTPVGGRLTLFEPYLWDLPHMQPAARLEAEYRSGRGVYKAATVAIDELVVSNHLNLDVALDLQEIHFHQINATFRRRSVGANITWNRLPLWLALGQVRPAAESKRDWQKSIELGSEYRFNIKRKQFFLLGSRINLWRNGWQWYSSLALQHSRYTAAVTYQQIDYQYQEVGLRLGVKLMVPRDKRTE